jgi:hypothetical protein
MTVLRSPCGVLARGDPVLSDDLVSFQAAVAVNDREGGQTAEDGRPGLGGADYTTLGRQQKSLAVKIPYRCAECPLNLLVDSTGIKLLGEGEWQARNMAFKAAAGGARCIWPWIRPRPTSGR